MHYFQYKNGLGNGWRELGNLGHLYVGYDNDWRPKGATQDLAPIRVMDLASQVHRDDLGNILVVSHPANHGRFTLLTFEGNVLRFWRVRGKVELQQPGGEIWQEARRLAGPKTSMYKDYPYFKAETAHSQACFRTLPVTLIGTVQRSALYTSIDSLAVYQYLNRGTCRPLWRITGGSTGALPSYLRPDPPASVFPVGTYSKEEPFAAFARLYLNDLLTGLGGLESDEVDGLRAIGGVDYRELALATLNPILVETAALALCQDLGLTPDIGVGKGKDVVDIRARGSGATGRHDAVVALMALQRLRATGVQLSEVLESRLLQDGVLDIQCKAADRQSAEKGILYFGPRTAGGADVDELLISDLPKVLTALPFSDASSSLGRFVALQAAMLQGEWAPSAAR